MNEILQQFARQWLKDNLANCTERQQEMFRRLYCYGVEEVSKRPTNEVVDYMKPGDLSWAMEQVVNTLADNKVKKANGEDLW